MSRYAARIAARRKDDLRLATIGVFPIVIDYSYLFFDYKEVVEARVEQEILDKFGGYDAMVKTFEAEQVGEKSMAVAEVIAHLRSLVDEQLSKRVFAPELVDLRRHLTVLCVQLSATGSGAFKRNATLGASMQTAY